MANAAWKSMSRVDYCIDRGHLSRVSPVSTSEIMVSSLVSSDTVVAPTSRRIRLFIWFGWD